MGVRGHVQVKQAAYGNQCLSSWVKYQVKTMLYQHEVKLYDHGGDDELWEIDIDDKFEKFLDEFSKHPNEMLDGYLGDDLKGNSYGSDLLALLREGMDAAAANNYTTINIDWF